MNKKPKSRSYAADTPLTKAELKRARPFSKAPKALVGAVHASMGRPAGRTKEPIHLSLDADLVEAMRRTGKGWQTRTNAILRKAMKLPPVQERVHH